MQAQITAEAFVRAWQTSDNVQEVCDKLNITPGGARVRATELRNRGVPLKLMPHGRTPLDIAALAKLARELGEDK